MVVLTLEVTESTEIDLIWGCDAERQLEVDWLVELLSPLQPYWIAANETLNPDDLTEGRPRVLIETGLLLLERNASNERKQILQQQRVQRLDALSRKGPFTLIHISDEEGLDGDQLYGMLPEATTIWRNFPYERFDQASFIHHFPIGPRKEFLELRTCKPASGRTTPWAFMGTLWRTGNRTLATSIFLREHPSGEFFGGQFFGRGLPIEQYRDRMQNSIFALCPEGDRHFDTFRLYESLQAGCIPLVVERDGQALRLLGPQFPIPIFENWKLASQFVANHLRRPDQLNAVQHQCQRWWSATKSTISIELREGLQDTKSSG